MQLSFDKIESDIIGVRLRALGKEISDVIIGIRLDATALATMGTADSGYLYYGKFVCVGLDTSFVASFNTTVEFDASSAITATGGLVGTFYDQLFNKVVTSAGQGKIYFVGLKIQVRDDV